MPAFADEQELHLLVGGLFERALATPGLGDRMAATGVVLHYLCHEPEASLVLDLPGRRVYRGRPDAVQPNAVMELTTADANRYWQGALNLTLALAEGRVLISGAVASLLRAGTVTQQLQSDYRKWLTDEQREDLLVCRTCNGDNRCAYHAP